MGYVVSWARSARVSSLQKPVLESQRRDSSEATAEKIGGSRRIVLAGRGAAWRGKARRGVARQGKARLAFYFKKEYYMSKEISIPHAAELEKLNQLSVKINSVESEQAARTYLIDVRSALRRLKQDADVLKKPYKEEILRIDAAVKPWAAKLSMLDETIEREILRYNRELKAAVAAANAKALNRYENKVDKVEQQAAAEGKPMPLVLPPILRAGPAKSVELEGGKQTTVTRKAWRIPGVEHPETLTRSDERGMNIGNDYFVLDTVLVGKIVRSGMTPKGIEVFEEESIALRK